MKREVTRIENMLQNEQNLWIIAHGNLKSNKKFVCNKSKTVAMEIYSAIKTVGRHPLLMTNNEGSSLLFS